MERRLAAILAADVVGYSRLMAANDVATLAALKAILDEVIEPGVAGRNGRIVKTTGDGVLVEFASVVDAVECAVSIQTALAMRNAALPDTRRIVFRIGINIGDIIVDDDDIFGDGVNVAARLEGLAEPGGVCVSQTVFNHLKNKVELGFEDLGEQRFKNIAEPVRVYRVLIDPADAGLGVARAAAPARRWRLPVRAAAVAVLAVAVGALVWQRPWEPRDEPASEADMALPLPEKPSIAVLPFDNLSGATEQEYFADGLTDDLITDLAKVSGLFVISRNSVFTYKGRPTKVQEVAEELGVRYVLEGSVRRAGDTVRINAQLIDALTGRHVWAERYDRDMSDIFALQDEVIGRIVAALAVELTDAEETRIARRPTENLEAYDLYLRAERAIHGTGGMRRTAALSLYKMAVERDPGFADAYAGMAQAAADVWRWDFNNVLPGPVARKLAYDAASQALAIDPGNGKAVAVLAKLQIAEGRYDDAVRSARVAVTVHPNNAEAYDDLAVVLSYSGQHAEALAAMKTAFRLDPKPPAYFHGDLGWVLFHGRLYAAAVEPLERALGAGVDYIETLAMLYARLGRSDEARTMVGKIRKRFPAVNLAYYRVIYAHFRRDEDLAHLLDSLRMAGIPAWPYGYRPPPIEARLDGAALEPLIVDRTWIGRNRNAPTFREYRKKGTVAVRDAGGIVVGKAWVEGDKLCARFEAVLVGRPFCRYVYRNPDGSPEDTNEYILVGPLGIAYYTVKP